jgi:pimeloyl-ACP methyl ester carboxylesterase
MSFIAAEGVKVHVAQWGAGDPILLIHGASSDMDVFQPTVIPLLEERYQLSAYDRPGMGFTSERPPKAETLAVQAKVAADVIEAMGLKKPIILAHSYGGAVALRLAIERPDLISGLVLIAPLAYDWPGGVSWYLYWSANPLIGGLFNAAAQPFTEAAARDGVKGTFFPLMPPDDYFDKASVARATTPTAMRSNGLDLLAAKREVTAQQDRYREITVPVAILVGDGDTVVSPSIHAAHLAKALPNVRLEVVHGAGHVPHETEPERLDALVAWVHAQAQALAQAEVQAGAEAQLPLLRN